jgi:hypothetical protein
MRLARGLHRMVDFAIGSGGDVATVDATESIERRSILA